jgi:hypothetical protein
VLKTLNGLGVPRVPQLVQELDRDGANRLVLVTTPVGTSLRNSRFEQEILDRLVRLCQPCMDMDGSMVILVQEISSGLDKSFS